MIHYSCDRCKRPISGPDSLRYVVTMQIEATIDVESCDCDPADHDSLLDIDNMLDGMSHLQEDESPLPLFQNKRYDLCPACYREFAKNPLAKEKLAPFGFSNN